MWKHFDQFREWIIRKADDLNFVVFMLIAVGIPGFCILIDHLMDQKLLGPISICFYALLGVLAQIRDIGLMRENRKREEYEWRLKNMPPYDGF